MKNEEVEILKKLHKIELHIHLEGAIPLPALWKLIEKYNHASKIGNLANLEKKFTYRSFTHFLRTFMWKNQFLKEYEDFTHIASEVAQDLAAQNICYAEMFFSPSFFMVFRGLSPKEITKAIRKGLDLHSDKTKINLIADFARDGGPELAMKALQEINEVRDSGVIGIGIGGSEQQYPPELFKEVYEEARHLGYKSTAHAGEAAGPESVWGAINALKVDRIGHGTRAIEDSVLVDYLLKKQIPIEMCPISNVRTKIVNSIEEHPIKQFYKKGLLISVNTDDPKMFNTSLIQEYSLLIENLGFSLKDIIVLIKKAVDSSWCDDVTREKLIDIIAANNDLI
jgi:adenosine deaminase